MAKLLIINADDFGYSVQRNLGIIKCIKKKRVSSVSVLMNGTSLDESQMLKELQQDNSFSIGLHFNLTEGKPVSCAKTIPSLVDVKGFFLSKYGIHQALEDGTLNPDHIALELKTQIRCFKDLFGQKPTHVDGHNHVHILPGIVAIFAKTLRDCNINCTRLPREHIPVESKHLSFYKMVITESEKAKAFFNLNNIKYPTAFVGMLTMGKLMVIKNISNSVLKAFTGLHRQEICELMVHPGLLTVDQKGGCGVPVDYFELSGDREFECNFLCGEEFLCFLDKHNIVLTNFERIGYD